MAYPEHFDQYDFRHQRVLHGLEKRGEELAACVVVYLVVVLVELVQALFQVVHDRYVHRAQQLFRALEGLVEVPIGEFRLAAQVAHGRGAVALGAEKLHPRLHEGLPAGLDALLLADATVGALGTPGGFAHCGHPSNKLNSIVVKIFKSRQARPCRTALCRSVTEKGTDLSNKAAYETEWSAPLDD